MIELPENIQKSAILSEADKTRLSGVTVLPVVDPSFEDEQLRNIFQYYSLTPDEMDVELHKYAAALLAEGKVNEAWQVLLTGS